MSGSHTEAETLMATDLSRRLAELLEPEPPIPSAEDQEAYFDTFLAEGPEPSPHGFWEVWFEYASGDRFQWRPITFDDNAMRRVREELKRRRGLYEKYGLTLWAMGGYKDWNEYWKVFDAPLAVQIAAAVEVLEAPHGT